MPIRIINITESDTTKDIGLVDIASIEKKHLGIIDLEWIDESKQVRGKTPLEDMYDWIANKRGLAYVRERETGIPISVFARTSKSGRNYVQAGRGEEWTNDLFDQILATKTQVKMNI